MPAVVPHCDLSAIDFSARVADADGVARVLPHRDHMVMLTAVVHLDPKQHLIVGYKDVRDDEFWVSGHFPGHPVFPGVLMCEAAAQLSAFYTIFQNISPPGVLMGLGGIEDTRYRKAVRPGDRLVLVGKGLRVRPRMTQFNVQGYVDGELAFHTDVLGVGLGKWEELRSA